MTKSLVHKLSTLLMCVTMAACSVMQRQAFAQLEVEVADVVLAGGFVSQRLEVALSVYNPNHYRLDASSIRYQVLLDTLRVAEGEIDRRITLEPRGTTEIRVPVALGFREVLIAANELSKHGTVEFHLLGDVKVNTPVGSMTRGFDERASYDGVKVSVLPKRR
jgi:LEA14-like dessication related protein